jgi:hypothetical protein
MGWLIRVLLAEAADVIERAVAERDEALCQLATTRQEVASILGPALAAASPGTREWSAVRDALAAVRPEREPERRATAASEMETAMPGNVPRA